MTGGTFQEVVTKPQLSRQPQDSQRSTNPESGFIQELKYKFGNLDLLNSEINRRLTYTEV